ncbi:MAG TPA: response regulator transcription factor [Chloroflexota bacterium]|jgi:DNA-binding response OmpR family regulator|nr:response regulator transcription factor [Chloroflexota bacterium]
MRILLVEDEQTLAAVLKRGLEEHSYAVDAASDGEEALAYLATEPYDLVILDVMLPDIDGYTVCRQLRADHHNMSVLMLTARDTIEDRVTGLDSGADDYLVKPFDPRELLARVRALLRRDRVERDAVLRAADIEVDATSREVWRAKQAVKLTTREYAILELFVRNPNRVLTRDEIAQHVWPFDFTAMSNVIDVYVGCLRRKLHDNDEPRLLRTVRGAGYLLHDGSPA